VITDTPGRIEATFEIDFSDERETDLFGRVDYQKQVAEIRRALYDGVGDGR